MCVWGVGVGGGGERARVCVCVCVRACVRMSVCVCSLTKTTNSCKCKTLVSPQLRFFSFSIFPNSVAYGEHCVACCIVVLIFRCQLLVRINSALHPQRKVYFCLWSILDDFWFNSAWRKDQTSSMYSLSVIKMFATVKWTAYRNPKLFFLLKVGKSKATLNS